MLNLLFVTLFSVDSFLDWILMISSFNEELEDGTLDKNFLEVFILGLSSDPKSFLFKLSSFIEGSLIMEWCVDILVNVIAELYFFGCTLCSFEFKLIFALLYI